MDSSDPMIAKIADYLNQPALQELNVIRNRIFKIAELAKGEYNLNYRIDAADGRKPLVFRINIGTQINRDDQIQYEYKALCLLKNSGVTPLPFWVDDSRKFFDQGILIMEYLPGNTLDYKRDRLQAAELFATIHQMDVPAQENHLIREDAPLSLIYEECAGLLQTYFDSSLADPDIRSYLADIRDWANENRKAERYYQHDPWPCIVNTEVNSGNFIANRATGSLHLVDWEMPRYGDPSQDISHFCSPLTTLWKSTFRMTRQQKKQFIEHYKSHITDAHLCNTLDERIRLRDPFVYLRGISWSAMGWVAYQTGYEGIRNADTWQKLQDYLQLDFIRSIFDPILKTSLQ